MTLKPFNLIYKYKLRQDKGMFGFLERQKPEQMTCKPGSVSLMPEPAGMMAIHLGCLLPDTSCNLPGHL